MCLILTAPLLASAACSRMIVVPASALGRLIEVDKDSGETRGIYPQALRTRGKQAGCTFLFPVVPRARAEFLVESGQADMLLGAVKLAQRDAWGQYVPMLGSAWVLVSRDQRAPPRSVAQLLALPEVRFNAVRGYNYGPAYLAMLARLEKRGALEYVSDAETVVRKMQAGRVDYTFMPSNTFAGALADAGAKAELGPLIRYSPLAEMPATTIGVYLSKKLPAADRSSIVALLRQIRRSGELLSSMRQHLSAEEMISSFALPEPASAP